MSSHLVRKSSANREFCWQEFVESQIAKLTPEEVKELTIWKQLCSLSSSVFELRDELGKSIREVANSSGIKAIHLQRLENFGPYPTLQVFIAIVHELGGEVIVVKKNEGEGEIVKVSEDHPECLFSSTRGEFVATDKDELTNSAGCIRCGDELEE